MFNSDVKDAAIRQLESEVATHERLRGKVTKAAVRLHDTRVQTIETIRPIERYVSQLANSPKAFKKTISEYRVRVDRFEATVADFNLRSQEATQIAAGTTGAGLLAAGGVATFAPTAAMAVATTFGTASTGTAIASLSGAAATNAALAWLGGGALAVGGGGMAMGEVVLGLAGPIGWAIGGLTLLGAGAIYASKNEQIAEEAVRKRAQVAAENTSLRAAKREVSRIQGATDACRRGCEAELRDLQRRAPSDYQRFSTQDKQRLAALINNVRSLGELLGQQAARG